MNNTDYGFIGMHTARIASQMRKIYSVSLSMSFNSKIGSDYIIISIHRVDGGCLESFHDMGQTARELMDEVFSYCMEHDLFEIPMNIKLID